MDVKIYQIIFLIAKNCTNIFKDNKYNKKIYF